MIRILTSIALLGLLALAVAGWWFAHRSLPVSDGIVTVPSLLKEVKVIEDDRGIPFIQASSTADLYRAQGYWTAARRMFQMDMLRRTPSGTLSEIYGDQCLAQDKLMRQIGMRRSAEKQLELLSPEVKKDLEAYAAGVNDFLRSKDDKTPLECSLLGYRPGLWSPLDTLTVMKYMDYLTHESWSVDELRQRIGDKAGKDVAARLFETRSSSAPAPKPAGDSKSAPEDKNKTSWLQMPLLPPVVCEAIDLSSITSMDTLVGKPGVGSNGWLIKGSDTDSGGALMALDRHTTFNEPNLYYALCLSSPDLQVSGVTIPGVPGILFGRNKSIAWGATALKIDDQDLFVEQFSPQFPDKYKTPQGWSPASSLTESIRCRVGLGTTSFQHKVFVTRHGPILSRFGHNAVSLQWSGYDTTLPAIETYWKLNRAKDWKQFRDILEDYRAGAQTFLYSDTSGNIGMQVAGNIPVRRQSSVSARFSSDIMQPGWSGRCDWQSRLPFSEMPVVYNPPEGYAIASTLIMPGTSPLSSPYPLRRIRAVLAGHKSQSRRPGLPDMAVLQGDELAPLAPLVKETVKQCIDKQEVIDKFQLAALSLFDEWDGRLDRQSSSASVYESFLRTVARRILVAKVGDALTRQYMERWPRWTVFVERILKEKSTEWLPPEERTFETFVVTSFSQAVKEVRLSSGSDLPGDWKWENLHQLDFEHILFTGLISMKSSLEQIVNVAPRGIGGDADTVNGCNISSQPGSYKSTVGPAMRLLIDMSDSSVLYETQPLGQSGHYFSSCRNDQMAAWILQKPLPVPFNEERAERLQRHKVIFTAKTEDEL